MATARLEGVEMDQENTSTQGQPDAEGLKSLHNYALAVYILYLAGFALGGIPTLVGFILALIKGPEAKGTYLESHFSLQVRSFLWGVGLFVLGGVLLLVGVGLIVLLGATVWLLYVWIKGLVRLLDGQPV